MAGNLRTSYLEVQSSFKSVFKGCSLEDLWYHPELKPFFKNKEKRELFLLELDNNTFVVKRYYGPGTGLIRYVFRGFRDKYGPENEWQKAQFLKVIGIKASEPVAFGVERYCGIIRRALLVTLKMEGIRLEDMLKEKAELKDKTRVVKDLAAFAGQFHASGLSHQDFYLCHFFWSAESREIALIDLQRIRHYKGENGQPPLRWIVKDLAQLDYSARNVLGREEYSQLKKVFVSEYEQYLPLITEAKIVSKIRNKVVRIARHDQKLRAREGLRSI
jgi:heptose I phosphotransferase